ncbi:OB-fold nucleic acid binding domain protein [Cordyceps fumosorosea ARSEF 2679]|uniref:OB-fold nucleic acid binding domain protein n=1 Tax=Cordyceps fumosorosea (strain ARSEF 2679) TaxID=1081104 RepID=A0A168BL51_CORFA|nr:OB-fold nucleic acid binding domain protein [Cordyceps fumosorosea ARSEF 2679]OAA70256.1 OB-fold nucleic acid binding domain protein [Cordyceps fumosorosea ARSEF 2679]
MSDTIERAFYPRYCFHLAPTADAWCFFRIADLFALQQRDGFEGEGLFFYQNLPIKWVRVVGLVVAVDEFAGRRAFTIDDSSGACIEAIVSLDTAKTASTTNEPAAAPAGSLAQPYDHVDVGSVVDVKGALTTFRDARQLKVEKMTTVPSTAGEVSLWAKRSAFRRDVLGKAWVLPDKRIRQCRRAAERSEAEAERKKQRLRDAAAFGSRHQTKAGKDKDKDAARGRRGVAEGPGKAAQFPSRDGEEALKVLVASCKGEYSALGL